MSLPKTFRQLEYLEFTGAQSLMIPKPSGDIDNFGIEIKYNDTSNTSRANSRLFSYAVGDGSGSKYLSLYYNTSGSDLYFRYMYSSSMTIGAVFKQNYGFGDHVFKLQSSEIYIDGVKNSTTSKPVTIKQETSSTYFDNIHISSNQYPNANNNCYKGKIYYVKFFIGDDEIRNLIPVQRKSDNELGYYDLDSNEFFTNTLTTPWVAGPVIDENSINKIIYGNETLIDLTGDTVTAADVAQGKTFHLADGSQAIGTSEGGSLEIVNYTLKASYARYNGINYSYFIGFMITNPDGSIKYIPNIAPQIGTHLVANDLSSSWQKNTSTYNTQWGHEFGSGGIPTSGSPKYWTITGTCFKGATIRPYIVGYGYTSSGYKAQVNYNIFGNTGSKLFDAYAAAQNTTRVGGFWVCNPIVINSSFTCTNTISNSGSNTSICTLNLTEI